MESKRKSNTVKKDERISLAPLKFEEVLDDLLKIKPVENEDLKKVEQKKKSKPKTKK